MIQLSKPFVTRLGSVLYAKVSRSAMRDKEGEMKEMIRW